MKTYITFDVGGTKIAGAVMTQQGKILRYRVVPSNAQKNQVAFESALIDITVALGAGMFPASVGLAVAGHVNHDTNTLDSIGPNFHKSIRPKRIAGIIEHILDVPVLVENDAKAFALGEAMFGAGKGHARVAAITVGTGIGGALVHNGLLVRGAHNLAGEVGQMFTRDARRTWGQLAAGPAFGAQGLSTEQEAVLLAEGLCTLLYLYDPDIVILGGGVASTTHLITQARQEARKRLYYAALKHTPIVKSRLKHAALLGALLIAQQSQ